ncbi:MAG: NAD(P)/FAD-dependent oxidoreductase [Lachnospiraceae bacterium]|nr:NAD(P)/FAD-dependent oxidoreductase [Lachnospiraceae bacterium]
MTKVAVIGAGAAGLMAAYAAGKNGCETVLIEKNEKAGKKIYITGKGRCNVTNACDFDVFIKNIINGDKFMYSSLRQFGPSEMMEFLESFQCKLKTERGNRVFPVSDHASDVTKAMLCALDTVGVRLMTETIVRSIQKRNDDFVLGVVSSGREKQIRADRVIICTGGLSYPVTGSTGDGYAFAKEFGHSINECAPSLCQVITSEDVSELTGISLKNVRLSVYESGKTKPVFSEIGELLFTHRGLSGPLVLTAEAMKAMSLYKGEKYVFSINLKPGLTEEELSSRLLRDFNSAMNSDAVNALAKLLISGIRQEVLLRAGIPFEKKVHDITKKERQDIIRIIRNFEFTSVGTGDFNEAVVTKGGVVLKDINPKTMESKIIPGLYFAGEVLDIDAFTGGFNLQIAWSTGYAAGKACAVN